MSSSTIPEVSKYPGWPSNYDWPLLWDWERNIKPAHVSLGQGLLYSDTEFFKTDPRPPHPEYLKKWRGEKDETVKNTANYFAFTEVQVLEACR